MQKIKKSCSSNTTHRILQPSTTLNRKYVKRPTCTKKVSSMHSDLAKQRREKLAEQINQERLAIMRRGYLPSTPASSVRPLSKTPSASTSSTTTNKLNTKTSFNITVKSNSASKSHKNTLANNSRESLLAKPLSSTTKVRPSIASTSSSLSAHFNPANPTSFNPSSTFTLNPSPAPVTSLNHPYACPAKQNSDQITPPNIHPYQKIIRAKTAQNKTNLPTSKQLKEQAISRALISASRSREQIGEQKIAKSLKKRTRFFHGKRALLALSCAAFSIAGLGYFVHVNFPDISARVTAMQAGFNIAYPSYIPKDYQLSGVTSDKNTKIIIKFSNRNQSFSISEERSTWDSQALLNNFVRKEWGNSYLTSTKQGITVYSSGNNAAWVNGGILYKIIDSGGLNKIQLHNIIYSL